MCREWSQDFSFIATHCGKRLTSSALHDVAAKVVTCVPSSGTAAIFDIHTRAAPDNPPYSYNEEVAYTVAHSAALTGSRSATIIKAHGFAKASNSVVDSLRAGTTSGFVFIVTYDAAGRHSDNIFD
jgi:TPP-dependent indolepyruvate ferredoxin oxidoreductase alpha subunit